MTGVYTKGRKRMTMIAGVLCLVATGTVITLPARAQSVSSSDTSRPGVPPPADAAAPITAPLPIDDDTRRPRIAPDPGVAPDTGYGTAPELRLDSPLADPMVGWTGTRGCYRIG